MDTKGLQKEFVDWCKSNKKQPKSKEETQQLFVTFMKEKHPEEYKAAVENQLKQAQKALHGAKLNYFRTLKNQCPEGEELYYYKKGGSVECGCKKKENGGEVKKDCGGSAIVNKFKKMRTGGNTVVNGSTKLPTIDGTKKMSEDPNKNTIWDTKLKKMRKMTPEEIARTEKNKADARQGKGEGTPQRKCGGKVKKHQEGGWLLRGIANPYINITEGVVNPDNKYQWVKRTINSNPGGLPNDTIYKAGSKSGFPKDQNSLKDLFNSHYIEDPEWNKKQNVALFLQKIINTKLKGDKLMNGYIPRVK